MTDRELDERIQQALLDALRDEWIETPACETTPSPRQQKRMQAMLADPEGYCKRQSRPLWKRAARTAASFFLVCTVSLTLLLAVSPGIRAGVLRWVREINGDGVVYRFAGEDRTAQTLRYTVTNLPEGYVKTEDRTEERGFFRVTYRNDLGQEIVLSCADMAGGAVLAPDLTDKGEREEIELHTGAGWLYPAGTARGSSALVWLDEDRGTQFMIEAPVNEEALLEMAIWVFPEMPQYRLSELPAGVEPVEEAPFREGPDSADYLYIDQEGYILHFGWMYMRQGIALGIFGSGGQEEMRSQEVAVNGLPGTCYWSEDPDSSPSVVWIDEEENLLFLLSGRVSREELLRLAEGVVSAE